MSGPELRAIRVSLGMSAAEFADSIRVERNSLYRLEGGHRQISPMLEQLAKLLLELSKVREEKAGKIYPI